jgi:hypothetical protein
MPKRAKSTTINEANILNATMKGKTWLAIFNFECTISSGRNESRLDEILLELKSEASSTVTDLGVTRKRCWRQSTVLLQH